MFGYLTSQHCVQRKETSMDQSHQTLINSLSELEEQVVPSTTGDGTKVGVIVGLIIMAFI
jgi:hypothetical protein